MKNPKISIIGAGAVGSTIAYAILLKNISANIYLIDIDQKRCHGEILDLSDALTFCESSNIQEGTMRDAEKSDIIIIAAGKRQKKGEDRVALYRENKTMISTITQQLTSIKKDALVIIVTNPLDLLTLQIQNELEHPRSRIFGTGTFLDTQRLRGLLARKLQIAPASIHAYILGEHGDMQFPAWSCASAGGVPITQFLKQKELDIIAQETKNKAYEIIDCKGATYWGIATCTAALCRTIIFDQKRITPLSVYNETLGVCLSMPAVLGQNGIEEIVDICLNEQEKEILLKSAKVIKSLMP